MDQSNVLLVRQFMERSMETVPMESWSILLFPTPSQATRVTKPRSSFITSPQGFRDQNIPTLANASPAEGSLESVTFQTMKKAERYYVVLSFY